MTRVEICEKYISWLNDSKINRYLEVRHSNESIETVPNYINALRNKSGCELFAIYMNKSQEFVGTLAITDFDNYNKIFQKLSN